MANYTSAYTGEAIDNALGKANSLCYGTTAGSAAMSINPLDGYELKVGVPVSIKFTSDVPANATLNINGKGAKPIFYNGVALAAGIILANSTISLVYDGTNFVVVSGGPKARVNGTQLILG